MCCLFLYHNFATILPILDGVDNVVVIQERYEVEEVRLMTEVTNDSLDDSIIGDPGVEYMLEHLPFSILLVSLHILNVVHSNL